MKFGVFFLIGFANLFAERNWIRNVKPRKGAAKTSFALK